MMKRLPTALLCVALAAGGHRAQAQVGIGTTTPDAKAALDISATDKGLLIPRLTHAQRLALGSVPDGLMVFQTDNTTGFWYYFGGSWVNIPNASTAGDNLGNHTATQNLDLAAHALTGTGDSITGVGVGVRADGGLNLGQNTTGNSIYLGYLAGQAVTGGGSDNLFVGYQAGKHTTSGGYNLFVGAGAGENNTAGIANLFVGYHAGRATTGGTGNLFLGFETGLRNTTGNFNQFVGHDAGSNNTTGEFNHFSGISAGQANTTGSNNTFAGYEAGYRNTTGGANQFEGNHAGYSNTTGVNNYYAGYKAGYTSTGSYNVGVGYHAGYDNGNGSNNTFVGYQAGPTIAGLTNANALGYNARVGASNSLVLGGTGQDAVRVGIGTTTPVETLDVAGSARVSGLGNGTSTRMVTASADGTLGSAAVPVDTDTDAQQLSLSGQTLSLTNGGSVTLPSGTGDNLGNHTATQNLALATFKLTGNGGTTGLRVAANGRLLTDASGDNVLVGSTVGNGTFSGANNVLVGYLAGPLLTSGSANSVLGSGSGSNLSTGANNAFLGSGAGSRTSSGSGNVFVGQNAGETNDGGTNNTALGAGSGVASSGLTNATALGYHAQVSQSNSLVLGGTGADAVSVGIGTTAPSSTLQVSGTTAFTPTVGLAGGSSAAPTALSATSSTYLGLAPASSSANTYQLPAPSACPGRMYVIRNNSSAQSAVLFTAGGSLYAGSGTTALTSYTLNPTASVKTVIVFSDGTNWTVGQLN